MEGDALSVVHSVPAEVDGRESGVVEDPFAFFIAPERAERFAVYRLRGTSPEHGRQARDAARAYLGRPFGLPTPAHPDKLTCSMLALAAWADVPGAPALHPEAHDLPLVASDVVLPADIAALDVLEEVPF